MCSESSLIEETAILRTLKSLVEGGPLVISLHSGPPFPLCSVREKGISLCIVCVLID